MEQEPRGMETLALKGRHLICLVKLKQNYIENGIWFSKQSGF